MVLSFFTNGSFTKSSMPDGFRKIIVYAQDIQTSTHATYGDNKTMAKVIVDSVTDDEVLESLHKLAILLEQVPMGLTDDIGDGIKDIKEAKEHFLNLMNKSDSSKGR